MRPVNITYLVTVGLLVATAGCGSGKNGTNTGAQQSSGHDLTVVAIGDSDATGVGDASGAGWVGRYGSLLMAKVGTKVTVHNLAAEGQTSDQLRSAVAHDSTVRRDLAAANVVLIGIGGADLNAGDDALSAGTCKGKSCYTPILRRFHANISAVASEVRTLAPNALLRAMSLPNGYPGAGSAFPPFATARISLYQATSERSSVCQAMRANGGSCIDVVKAFNGPSGDEDAYAQGLMTKNPCCYPSAKGQQLIARLLIDTGLEGLPTS